MLRNLSKAWLLGILPFLPFQLRIAEAVKDNFIRAFIQYLDEITIVVFLPIVLVELFRTGKKPGNSYQLLIFSIIAFAVFGVVSGIINRNSPFITFLGIFDYIKNFLVIFIYSSFFRDADAFKKPFHYLLAVAVFLGIVAIIQEFWALVSHYILMKDISEKEIYIFRYLSQENWMFQDFWRMGIYRAPSLTIHPNNVGLFSLLIITIYLFTARKVNPIVFISLFAGIFVSISRMIYFAFMLLAGIQLKNRKWLIIPGLPVLALLIFMSFMPASKSDIFDLSTKKENETKTFRIYAKEKAIEVFNDHPLFGVGPGYFGGVISIIYNSPVYREYNFSEKWLNFMKPFRSLDQFWPQLLAETGIVGTSTFGVLLITLLIIFLIKRRISSENKELFAGFVIATVFMFIYSLGSGLNITLFLFTYSALAGMAIGHEDSSHK